MTEPKPKSPALNNSLLLPTMGATMLAPTPTPQKLSTGSATGNPRNKCALKPGHSLMDWVRLGNSGADLSGTRGRVMPVSGEELAKHKTREDAWMAVRGNVYNVTRYMDFHPGGVDELMRGVGRDATKLFDEVHAWVNYQQLLAKCYIGPLRNVVKIDSDTVKSLQSKTKPEEFTFAKPVPPADIVPRFDWIQRRSDITFYIYTRQFSNPGLIVRRKSDKELELLILIEHAMHSFELQLQQSIDWPVKTLKIASETGKIEVNFSKTHAELWTSYGAHTTTKLSPCIEVAETQYDFELIACKDFNHDSYEMCLKGCKDTAMLLPVGYHVTISTVVNGELTSRSYTPVESKYSNNLTGTTENCLKFLIKSYSSGVLSSYMRQLKVGAILQISPPKGGLSLNRLLSHKHFTLMAAGSGLTPFLGLIEQLLRRSTNKIEHLHFMYFNKTEADIWCRNTLEKLQTSDERFQFTNILSQSNAAGLKGRISKDLIASLVDKKSTEYSTFVGICGPSAFNQQAQDILKELNFNTENTHIFQG